MNDQKIKNLLDKYLSGDASKAEAFIVESWLESFQLDGDDTTAFDTESNHDALAEQIIAKTLTNADLIAEDKYSNKFGPWKMLTTAAALFTVISSVAFFLFKYSQQQNGSVLATAYTKYDAPIKQFKQLQLPDSSIVYLNANSTLEVQQDFTKHGERRVRLRGEAFFDVKKNRKHPFKIQVGELQVNVIGTSFNIKAHPTTGEIKVAVKTGKVNISSGSAGLASLVANQALIFNTDKKVFDVKQNDESAKALWREGVVVFDNATFAEISATVYGIYGASLKSSDNEMLMERFNFTIRSSRTLQQTVDQLCEIINKKHRKEGSSIIIF